MGFAAGSPSRSTCTAGARGSSTFSFTFRSAAAQDYRHGSWLRFASTSRNFRLFSWTRSPPPVLWKKIRGINNTVVAEVVAGGIAVVPPPDEGLLIAAIEDAVLDGDLLGAPGP